MTPYRVLIVENELVVGLDLQARLTELGYAFAGHAATGAAAVTLAERQEPDLILMDVQLAGDMDGIAAAREIRRHRDVPVLFLTAYGDPDTLQRAQAAEPYGFLLKPVSDQDLRAAIETALARHHAEQRIHQSESRLQRSVKAGKVGLWDWDLATNQVYYSPEWKRQIGYEDHEIGEDYDAWQSRVHPEDLDLARERIRHSLREPWPDYEVEFRFRHKNGSYRWMLAQASVEMGKQGKPLRLVGSHIDITTQKAHEAEIKRLNRLYLALSQVNQLITRITTREELLAGVCQLLVRHGQLKMAWIGWRDPRTRAVIPVAQCGDEGGYLSQIQVTADDRPEGRGPTGTAIREARTAVCNDFLGDASTAPWHDAGAQRGFRSSASFPIHEHGEVRGALTVYAGEPDFFRDQEILLFEEAAVDVSFALDHLGREIKNQRVEEALRLSEARFRAVVEAAPDAILIQTQGRFAYVNPAAVRLFGVNSEGELLGSPIAEHFHPDHRAQVSERIRQLNDEQRAVPLLAERIVHRDGTQVEAEVSAVPFHYQGQPGALVFARDIRDRKSLEEQLRQAQKLESVGQLAGGVAHDFNNILAAMMLHLNCLQENPGLDRETQESLGELVVEARRAANLTRQLLMFSRRSVMEVKVLDLNELVPNLLKMLGRLIGEHITVRFDRHEVVPGVEADAGMLEQVLMNLAVNARDAMPQGGRLTIGVELIQIDARHAQGNVEARPGPFVCLAVADTGCGMDETTLQRIFDPFFTTKAPGQGTGLGLATVHGIVGQHQGWIEVESHPGQGTTFKVYLPAAAKTSATNPVPAGKMAALRGHETILLVEDEASLRRVVAQSLRQLGYQMLEAGNGREALALWKEHAPRVDLLFTDLVMPEGLTGLDLAERLTREKPDLKVIISSGYNAEIAGHGRPTAGDIVYLQKPYEAEILSKTIRGCLDRT